MKKEKEKNEKSKADDDIAYYTAKLKLAHEARESEKKENKGSALIAYGDSEGEEQVWSTGSDDEEMRKPTHGKSMEQLKKEELAFAEDERIWMAHCAQVQAENRGKKGSGSGSGLAKGNLALFANCGDLGVEACDFGSVGNSMVWESSDDEEEMAAEISGGLALMAGHEPATQPPKTIPEQVTSLLNSFNIPESSYKANVLNITNTCTAMNRMLSESNESANKARNSLCVVNTKLEDLRGRYACLETKIENLSDDVIKLRRENVILLKQRNIFCNTARRLHAYITRVYHSCSVSKEQHKRLLPFTTMPVTDDNKLNFDCESIV
ncbi:hypothetical protein E9993_22985, partial [Labilibacter sediminis]